MMPAVHHVLTLLGLVGFTFDDIVPVAKREVPSDPLYFALEVLFTTYIRQF